MKVNLFVSKDLEEPYAEIYTDALTDNIQKAMVLLENEDEHIKDLLSKRYAKLRETGWSEETMIHMLDEYEKEIFDSGAYEREAHRWPHAHYVEKGHKLNLFKTYVKERLQVMDKYVADITR